MAKYDPTHPALCLLGSIQSQAPTPVGQYSENDETGLFGVNISYQFAIVNIATQSISDASVRESNFYNGLDIKTGDYITDDSGQKVLRITQILSKAATTVEVIATDVDGISYRQYNSNLMGPNDKVIIFELSENGNPVIAGATANQFLPGAIDKLQSRFSIDEHDERFRFDHIVAPNINIGEIVTIDDNGNIVRNGAIGGATTPLGTVVSKARNGKSVYVKPFNKIIENYPDPTMLTGSPGDIYYSDTNNPGKITTTKELGAKSIYMHLRDAIPTEVVSTSSTSLPNASDLININNITVYNGPLGHSVSTIVDLQNMINGQTSLTKVTASADIADISVETDNLKLNGNIGEAVALVSNNGGGSYTYPVAEFNDGTSSIQITFDPFNHGLSPIGYLGSSQYLVITATEMAQILNTEFSSNGINLVASTFIDATKNYPFLKINGQNGASIVITNISSDAFGTNFAGANSASGLDLNTPIGLSAFLKLTRADGGDILITGGQVVGNNVSPSGGYINSNGICSSSSGSPAMLLMIEGSGDGGSGVAEVGVNVSEDHNMTPNETNGNGSPTGLYISFTPFLGSMVEVRVNGLDANVGEVNDYQTQSCYFSPDGFVVRNIEDIEAGDQLYWNGTTVGFELDDEDDIDFLYQTSSSNI